MQSASRLSGALARLALALVALATLASCGGGAVSSPPPTVTPGPLSITPATATLYSDLPTTFVVSGGNGNYIVTSSDQAVVPVIGSFTGNTLTVVPNPVAADTNVTITVRDTASTTPVTAALTVKPRTISNTVTITPSASQSAACGTAVCSGGDAEVRVSLAQAGIPLTGRSVRFDVVSGDVRIITSPAGTPEALATSAITTTDSTGTARVRIRVLSDAASQTALLQVTDLSTGFTQRTSVTIAPSSNAPLNAQPNTIVFQGVTAGTCASGISADVIVFGGRPPYLISQPGSFNVTPSVLTQNGGRFTVTATGQCTAGSQIAVVDNNGASVSVVASNTLSSLPVPTPTTPTADFAASPSSVTLDSCTSVANVTLSGGSGTYFGASSDALVEVTVSGNLGSIRRAKGGPVTGPVNVTFSDGKTSRAVQVTLSGAATGTCS